jgi:hypothetical protein
VTAAVARLDTPIFARIRETWTLTVLSLMSVAQKRHLLVAPDQLRARQAPLHARIIGTAGRIGIGRTHYSLARSRPAGIRGDDREL